MRVFAALIADVEEEPINIGLDDRGLAADGLGRPDGRR